MNDVIHQVVLIDGSVVASDSEAWRHECEARAIAKLATLADRDRLIWTLTGAPV